MSLHDLITAWLHDTLSVSLPAFKPELALCLTIVLLLGSRLFFRAGVVDTFYVALGGTAFAFWFSQPWLIANSSGMPRVELFTGCMVVDGFTSFFRVFLMAFLLLFLVFTKLSGIPDREDGPDLYTLVLGSALGMCLMASANHFLMVFLAVEMASVPSYALAGLMKGRRKASEAALKYSIYGAGAAGVMLYGLSLLCGCLGTAHLPTSASQLAIMLDPVNVGQYGDRMFVLALGGLMVMVGLAFKLSAVPFHFWCPDVFDGASAEVNAFLSVASKAAAFALLIRLCVGMTTLQPGATPPAPDRDTVSTAVKTDASTPVSIAASTPVSTAASAPVGNETNAAGPVVTAANVLAPASAAVVKPARFKPVDKPAVSGNPESLVESAPELPTWADKRLQPARVFLGQMIALIAAVTCTFGNLAAYGQKNIKRLLAYSTIAHAGYMLMPVAAGMMQLGMDLESARSAFAAVLFYLLVYLFMNTGAFAIVAFLRNEIRSEEIADYAGLIKVCPGVTICFCIILLSLVGLPPMLGLIAKVVAFYELSRAGMWWLLVVGGVNTVLSLFYYLKVVKCMTLEPEPESRLPVRLPLASLTGAYSALLAVPLLIFFFSWNDLYTWALNAVRQLF